MGMAYDEDAAARRRQELKKRLLAQQERENQGGYQVNEYGEIIRDTEPPSGTPSHFGNAQTEEIIEERAGVFALIISFFFPIIGIFIYFINRRDVVNPKAYLYAAGWGFGFNLLLSLI